MNRTGSMTTRRMRVTVRDTVRAGHSVNGNPTWNVLTDEGTFRTLTDASVGYSITVGMSGAYLLTLRPFRGQYRIVGMEATR